VSEFVKKYEMRSYFEERIIDMKRAEM